MAIQDGIQQTPDGGQLAGLRGDRDGALRADRPAVVFPARFEVRDAVGRGGFGTVYIALDRESGAQVALKVPHAGPDPVRRRFRRECQVLAALRHRHVVHIVACDPDGSQPWLAMEYVLGSTLPGLRGALRGMDAWFCVRRAVTQLLGTLADLHDAGIVHRDISAENVLVDGSGDARLVDFGLAWDVEAALRGSSTAAVGNWPYMAPELFGGIAPHARSDLYAAGALVFELLTGVLPFTAPSLSELLAEKRHRVLTCPDAGLEPALWAWVKRCLAAEPRGRPRSAWLALRELEEARLLDPADVPSRLPQRLPFDPPSLDRGAELRALGAVADCVAREGGTVVVSVSGPAGVGKSWVLERALRDLPRHGLLVAGAVGAAATRGPGGALGALVRRLHDLDVPGARRADRGALVEALLGAPRDGTETARPTLEPRFAHRTAAVDGVVQLIRDAATSGPMAVVLDQVEGMDEVGLEVLQQLLRVLSVEPAPPMLLVLGSRGDPTRRWVERRALGDRWQDLPIEPFGAEALEQVFAGPLTAPAERRNAAWLLSRQTGGMVDRVQDHLERWRSLGWIMRDGDAFCLTPQFLHGPPLPLEEAESPAILRDGLPPDLPPHARDLAVHLAVLQPVCEVELLEESTEDPWTVLRAIETLRDHGVIAAEVTGAGVEYRVRDGVLAERLERALPDGDRRRLHRVAAERLALTPTPDPERLARHFRYAGDLQRAAQAGLRAGDLALRRFAWGAAMDLYRQAADDAAGGDAWEPWAEALSGVVFAAVATTAWETAALAAETLVQRARDWRNAPLGARASWMAGVVALATGRPREALTRLHEGLGWEASGILGAEIRMALARALVALARDPEAVALLTEAARIFRECGDPVGEARALQNQALQAFHSGQLPEAERRFRSLLAGPIPSWLRAAAESNYALVLFDVGEPPNALEWMEHAIEGFDRVGRVVEWTNGVAMLVQLQARAGVPPDPRLDQALAFARRARLWGARGTLLMARAQARPPQENRAALVDCQRAVRCFQRGDLAVQGVVARVEHALLLARSDLPQAVFRARRAVDRMPAGASPSVRWQCEAALGLLVSHVEPEEGRCLLDAAIGAAVVETLRLFGARPGLLRIEAEWTRPRLLVPIQSLVPLAEFTRRFGDDAVPG